MLNDNMLRINWTMPNFVNVCIDGYENGEFSGRFFHKYDREPVAFEHFMGMVKQMEDLYDTIDYPQATFRKRSFLKEEKQRLEKSSRDAIILPTRKSSPSVLTDSRASQERGHLSFSTADALTVLFSR